MAEHEQLTDPLYSLNLDERMFRVADIFAEKANVILKTAQVLIDDIPLNTVPGEVQRLSQLAAAYQSCSGSLRQIVEAWKQDTAVKSSEGG